MPPTGNTNPYRDISPVIAKSDFTLLYVSNDTNAVVIVTPALGPSLGTAAAGKCTWISIYLNKFSTAEFSLRLLFGSSAKETLSFLDDYGNKNIEGDYNIPILFAFVLIQLKLVLTDSFITSPNLPVRFNTPFPEYFVVSINRAFPPTSV